MKIDIENSNYPEQLRKIENPPNQLYLEGNIELLKLPGIAIIGSRKNTKYGERMTRKFSKELNLYGLTIISGMAIGIDTFAHEESIKNTIAVLPSGFNNIYPKENIKLYENILKNGGLVITEYEENKKADSNSFLERNRIVSGLAIGTLVVEGGYRSGTSVTARLTKKQGKNLFCIPSSLENRKGITPNQLIKEGAYLVTEVEDIIVKYPNLNLRKRKIETEYSQIDEEYKLIYNIMSKDEKIHINEITKRLKLPINETSYKLMMLELEDKVVALPGNNYIKK